MEYPTMTAPRLSPAPKSPAAPLKITPWEPAWTPPPPKPQSKRAQQLGGLTAKGLARLSKNPWLEIGRKAYEFANIYRMMFGKMQVGISFNPGNNWVNECKFGPIAHANANHACTSGWQAKSPSGFAQDEQTPYYYFGGVKKASFRQDPVTDYFGLKRYYVAEVWRLPAGLPDDSEFILPHTRPATFAPNPIYQPDQGVPVPHGVPSVPSAPPALDPFSQPVAAPMAPPVAIPYRLIPHRQPNPWRSPTEQTQRGPLPDLAQHPTELPQAGPTLEFTPDGRMKIGEVPKLRPTKAGEKERKTKYRAGAAMVINVVGKVTEGIDALEAIYDALPDEVKPHVGKYVRKQVTPQDKARILYRHFDKVDMTEAIKNLIENEIEDRSIGYAGKKLKEASKNLRPHGTLPIGFGAGKAL